MRRTFRHAWVPTMLLCVFLIGAYNDTHTHDFEEPIDALSVGLTSDRPFLVRAYTENGWSPWQQISKDQEQDPRLQESNLLMFDAATSRIQIRGDGDYELHPIRVSDQPARYFTAATSDASTPRILSREEWGADDGLLFRTDSSTSSGEKGDNGAPASQRVQDCLEMQTNYPNEFKVEKTVTEDGDGKKLRWPWQYSKDVNLLVVHHTAVKSSGDIRSGAERMRALYQYHAQNRGWGDIGYHYLIDDDGQIFEGKSGGKGVVAGHAYCNNIGTIGISLMGNFEVEKPTQQQMKSLQWLLDHLGNVYDIDPSRNVSFHGKTTQPIVGHRDLLSTDCPGYYVAETLGQVRTNVKNGDLSKSIIFPRPPVGAASSQRSSRSSVRPQIPEGITSLGTTLLQGRPGSVMLLSVRYQAPAKGARSRERITEVEFSDPSIRLWQEFNGRYISVRGSLLSPKPVAKSGTMQLQLKVQFPRKKGQYSMKLGNTRFTLKVEGRSTAPSEPQASSTTSSSAKSASSRSSRSAAATSPLIRIRLGYTEASASLRLQDGSQSMLSRNASDCVLTSGGAEQSRGIVRIGGAADITTIESWKKAANRFRGVLECRVIDDQLVLINELPLEQYLDGLAEEPDTEPYEKQRAFAIAARTYAAFYLQSNQRKFPGKPYDGSDSPAQFQAYGGVAFEVANPRWVQAARETAGQVLKKNGQLIKPPYFSSDDGRTRDPVEAGWNNFPFAEVFASKSDPWCAGMENRGHGVGMSGCGSEGQANEGKTAQEILQYYYPTTVIDKL